MIREFLRDGWCRFEYDESLMQWVRHVLPAARAAVAGSTDPGALRCDGTWFTGIHALPNDAAGAVAGGPPLQGRAQAFVRTHLETAPFGWDSGQISVVYPGYPRQGRRESDAVFRFRRRRDAAHVDGILHEGPRRRRFLRTWHGFILGIPLVDVREGMSPLALWEGSHELFRHGLLERYGDLPPERWPAEDVTEAYQAIRSRVFEQCPRVEVAARPGEAYLLHRLTLHGISPWSAAAPAAPDGRMIVYFRPDNGTPARWLQAP